MRLANVTADASPRRRIGRFCPFGFREGLGIFTVGLYLNMLTTARYANCSHGKRNEFKASRWQVRCSEHGKQFMIRKTQPRPVSRDSRSVSRARRSSNMVVSSWEDLVRRKISFMGLCCARRLTAKLPCPLDACPWALITGMPSAMVAVPLPPDLPAPSVSMREEPRFGQRDCTRTCLNKFEEIKLWYLSLLRGSEPCSEGPDGTARQAGHTRT